MKNQMMTPRAAAELIESGAIAVVAGDEDVLAMLPVGNWIGGTSVYFMTEEGGRVDRENVFVTVLTEAEASKCRYLTTAELPSVAEGRYENGATMMLVPGLSAAHQAFAIEGAQYEGLFEQPVMGWITGVHLDDLGSITPKIFDGSTGKSYEDGAIVMYTDFPADKVLDLDIINLFEQDQSTDVIEFNESGFNITTAIINGEEVNFADYIAEKSINTQLPLVANYAGAMINVSFQAVDEEAKTVALYAPVVPGTKYHIAKDPGDYATVFAGRVGDGGSTEFSCNCILNYVYGELEGKRTADFTGPATFGEIAYVLLNQTMVHMRAMSAEAVAAA